MRSAARTLARLAVALVATLMLTEASLQLVHAFRARLVGTPLGRVNALLDSGWTWGRYFLNHYKPGELVYEGLHTSHPTRGWALLPGLHARRGDIAYTTNGDGFRSLHELTNAPDRYEVIVLGDSFTFGDGIDDSVTWPRLLEQQDSRLNVFNLAGTGYGTDQMYVTLQEALSKYQPRLVIAAFTSDDLARSLLDFRDFKKPRFVIRNDELVLTNTPSGTPAEVVDEIRRNGTGELSSSQIVNAVRAFVWRRFTGSESACDPKGECTRLNARLFDAMHEISRQHHADFLIVYLPFGRELVDARFRRDGETFFDGYRARHDPFFFNPRPELLAASYPKAPGHYSEDETSRLAPLIYREIRKLSSWKTFAAASASP